MLAAHSAAQAATAAAEIERAQFEENARIEKIRALQEIANRQEILRHTNAANATMAGALGFDPARSPSFAAIQEDNRRRVADDIANIRLLGNYAVGQTVADAQLSSLEAGAMRRIARYSIFSAIGTGFGAAVDIRSLRTSDPGAASPGDKA